MIQIKHNKVRMTEKRSKAFMGAQFHAVNLGLLELEVTIRIAFCKGYAKKSGMLASCVPLPNKVILITLDCGVPDYVLNTLIAHEMVHAKQYITGELGYNKKGEFTWYGKKAKKGLAYHELPWEIEAMQKEAIMAHSFIHFISSI